MYTFKISPESEGFKVDDGETNIATELDGGKPRVRADKLGAVAVVNCQWTVGPAGADYIRAFRRQTHNGADPFNIALVGIDSTTPQTYVAQFVPGTFGLRSQSGLTYVYGAQLWVKPIPPSSVDDLALMEAF